MLTQQDMNSSKRINTTIGDLVEAISLIADQAGKTREEGRALTILALEDMLRRYRVKNIKTSAR